MIYAADFPYINAVISKKGVKIMSIQFDEPMNEESSEMIKKMFGDVVVVSDEQNVLLEKLTDIHQKEMSLLAKTAKQPVTAKMHDDGDIVEMIDGTKYQVTKRGWRKI
jgi:hypothetical protein